MRDPVIALVVAVAENGAIGKDGNLPWRLSTAFRHFRKVTLGKPIIMGRRTFESLGRVLDRRVNIVVTRKEDYQAPGAVVVHSLEHALDVARDSAQDAGVDEIMVIGGADIFREVLPRAGRIHLTEVHAAPQADIWFPEWDRGPWREVSREHHAPGPKDDHPFSIVVLERAPSPR